MRASAVGDHTYDGLQEQYVLFEGEPISVKKLEEDGRIIKGKGEFLGGGATGLVELLESGDVIKSPWANRPSADDCRREIAVEAQIYERLGTHPRLVKVKHWDSQEHILTLEYMPHGSLRDYVRDHGHEISPAQPRQWAAQAAEGLALLHSRGVVQADVGPHNFLLDADLGLKICDFGGSSLDGSRATVAPGVRYRLPIPSAEKRVQPTSIREDLFALGSTIYFIATGHAPYHELDDDDEVQRRYQDGMFPDLGGVPSEFAEGIALCWRQEAESAESIAELVRRC